MTEATIAAPAFAAIPIAELPTATRKGADPESIALGQSVLAVLTPDVAAGDPETFAERKDAINRAAVIKRAVRAAGGAPDGFKIGSRILASADGYRVVVTLATTPADAPKRGRKVAD